jgi:UDP-GlcNAc:undecaprenyl-phosphate GlcNAc-1-phosphate transferase
MEHFQLIVLIILFITSFGFSVLVNWLMLKFYRNFGIRKDDNGTEEIRWASTKKPALGGISFFIAFLISFSLLGVIPNNIVDVHSLINIKLLGIAGASSLGFLIGLADDAYNTNPLIKLMGQFTCAFILIATGVVLPVSNMEAINFIFTIVWVIGLMNSINMLDNMDGISTSISASIILSMFLYVVSNGPISNDVAFLMVGVFASLVAFLLFNWNPSKMYMGDTGSMFLGVFLAALSIMSIWSERDVYGGTFQVRQFVIPMLIFIIPLIDTTTVTIRRLMRRQSPFLGGRDHITHHLAYLGLKDNYVAIILLIFSLISIPIVLLYTKIDWYLPHTIIAFVYFSSLFTIMQVLYNKGAKLNKAKIEKVGNKEVPVKKIS